MGLELFFGLLTIGLLARMRTVVSMRLHTLIFASSVGAPLVAVSAKKRQHIGKLFETIERVRKGAQNRISTGALNRLLHRAIENTPGPIGSSAAWSFKLLYATQVNEHEERALPVPHFVLFANRAAKLRESYVRHLENIIRGEWPGEGLPFIMSVRGKPAREPRGKK